MPFLFRLQGEVQQYAINILFCFNKIITGFEESEHDFDTTSDNSFIAHNNNYVVWSTVPGCVGMRSQEAALFSKERKLVVRLADRDICLELFPHNQRAYDAVSYFLDKKEKAAVIHPTGTGKSFIAFRLVLDNPQAEILWLSPSEYIFRTQIENLKKSLSGAEGMDKNPCVSEKGNDEKDAFLIRIIKNLEFMTYSRLMFCVDSFSERKFDYIILDEFHRCGAPEWGRGVRKLLLEHPETRVLGLSATNVRYLDGRRDMAEELFEGCIASKMTLGEAVA